MSFAHGVTRRFEQARREVRQAWRAVRRMPGLALVVVLSLGVGIGVNTAVFSWLEAVVLRPLPGVHGGGADFHFVEPRGASDGSYPGVSWREYQDLRTRLRAFQDLVAFRMTPLNVGDPGRAERTYGQLVSDNFFPALGLTPARGRFFAPDEVARPGGAPVAVVSYRYWRARLGGAPDVVGRTLRVNDRPVTVVGVAPEGFQGTVLALDFDLWVPATLAPVLLGGSRELDDRDVRGYTAMGRLRPRVSLAAAQADVDGAMQRLAREQPRTNADLGAEVLPFWKAPRGPQRFLAGALVVLQGLLLLLLLAVCANTANLLLARASARRREVGVRRALGAGPARVAALLLTESMLLALAGAALGALVAVWGSRALRAVPMIATFPIHLQTGVSGVGLAVVGALGIGCGLLFGAAPAWQLAVVDPQTALRAGAGVQSGARGGARNTLMAVEVGLALVVLLVAGLFLRRFDETRGADPGFRPDGVLLAAYDLTGRPTNDAGERALAAMLLARLRALPEVADAAVATSVPLDIHGLPLRAFEVEGHVPPRGADRTLSNVVAPGYFRTLGIPLRAGRDVGDLLEIGAPGEVVVNEAFVRRYLPAGAEPLGRWLVNNGRRYTVVGVVRTTVSDAFGEPPTPVVYYSFRDRPAAYGTLHVRARAGAEAALAPAVRRVVHEVDPSLPLYDVRTFTAHVERNLIFQRIPARLFAVLGPLLLALAAVGIYAVVAYAVARRAAELGLRLALGATPGRLVGQIVRETLGVVGRGAAVGWCLAFLVQIHLVHGRAPDPVVFLGVPALLLGVAAVASWLPARRASRADPLVALRLE